MSDETLDEPLDAKVYGQLNTSDFKLTDGDKKLSFDISNISPATERTCVAPDSNSRIPATNSTSITTNLTLPSGINNTFYGIDAGDDVTTGTGNTIIGNNATAGSATAVNRIVINTEGKYDDCFHLPSSTFYLPNLNNNTFDHVLYYDITTKTIAYGLGGGGGPGSDIPDGTEAIPGLKFENEGDTGFYRTTANQFSISIDAVERVRFNLNQLLTTQQSSPTFSFISAATSGMGYSSSALRFYNTSEQLSLGTTSNFFTKGVYVSHSNNDNRATYNGTTFSQVFAIGADTDNGTGNYKAGFSFDLTGTNLNFNYLQTAQNVRLAYARTTATSTTQGAEVGQLSFYVKPSGTAAAEILRLDSTVEAKGPIVLPAGTAANPSMYFSGDTNTGIYSTSSDDMGLTANGAVKIRITDTFINNFVPVKFQDGSAGVPSITFVSDDDTGIYRPSTNSIAITTGGTAKLTMDLALCTSTLPIVVPIGGQAAPSLTFSGDTDTGIFQASSDAIGFTTGGTLRFVMDTTICRSIPVFGVATGTVGAPGLTFTADLNTGIYRPAEDNLAVSCGGVQTFLVDTNYVRFRDATLANPNGFISDNDTGFYRPAADTISFVTGANTKLVVSNSLCYSTVAFGLADGLVGTPSLTFSNDLDTGIYRSGANTMQLVAGGAASIFMNTDDVIIGVPCLNIQNGSASAPALRFFNDSNTGIYSVSADTMGFTTGGTQKLEMSTTAISAKNVWITTDLGTALGGVIHYGYRSSGGVLRFGVGLQATEGGSNTGSDFTIWTYADGGGFLSAAMQINRATSNTTFSATVTADKLVVNTAGNLASGEYNLLVDTTSSSATDSYYIKLAADGKDAGGIQKNGVLQLIGSTSSAVVLSTTYTNGIYNYHGADQGVYFKTNSFTSLEMYSNSISGINTFVYYDAAVVINSNLTTYYSYYLGPSGTPLASTKNFSLGKSSGWTFHEYKDTSNDVVFRLRGDGNMYADGSYLSPAADYAEYFESADGKEIPVGNTVELLSNGKISPVTQETEENKILGVIRSKKPSKGSSVIGNSSSESWSEKYLTNDLGEYILEYHEMWSWTDEKEIDPKTNRLKKHSYMSHAVPTGIVFPENKQVISGPDHYHYKLNPDYDPNRAFISREKRPEWHIVGLLGQVPVRKDQRVAQHWIKIGDVSNQVAKYYIK